MFVAGVSQGLGTQVLVLFVNSASRRRFWVNLLLAGLLESVVWLAWAASIWVLARVVFGRTNSFAAVYEVAALGAVPYLLGFLIVIPSMGPGIQRILGAASLVVVVAAVSTTYSVGAVPGLALTIGGWLLLNLAQRGTNRPVSFLRGRLWEVRPSEGTRTELDELAPHPEAASG